MAANNNFSPDFLGCMAGADVGSYLGGFAAFLAVRAVGSEVPGTVDAGRAGAGAGKEGMVATDAAAQVTELSGVRLVAASEP